jgi:hypothetical protein
VLVVVLIGSDQVLSRRKKHHAAAGGLGRVNRGLDAVVVVRGVVRRGAVVRHRKPRPRSHVGQRLFGKAVAGEREVGQHARRPCLLRADEVAPGRRRGVIGRGAAERSQGEERVQPHGVVLE